MIGRNSRRAVGLTLVLATSFVASGALAQRPAPIVRATPQPQGQPQTNPQLQISGVPTAYTVDTVKLEGRVKQLEQQIANQQQLITSLIVQLGAAQNKEADLETRFQNHKHKLQGVGLRMFEVQTCTYPGGYPSCKLAPFPNMYASALSVPGAGGQSKDFDTTTGPIP